MNLFLGGNVHPIYQPATLPMKYFGPIGHKYNNDLVYSTQLRAYV